MNRRISPDARVFLTMFAIIIAGMSWIVWRFDKQAGILVPHHRAAPMRPFWEPHWYHPIDSTQTSKDVTQ